MPLYSCVFFDLDHTLWDYETNCKEALQELYHSYGLNNFGVPSFHDFHTSFNVINTNLWDRYDRGEIHRDVIRFERFDRILKEFGVNHYEMSLKLSDDYVNESPKKKNLMPSAGIVLEYLSSKNYPMYIITNGFDEIQSTKLQSSGIEKYFQEVVTSQKAGYKKPAKEIFHYALDKEGILSHQAIMIGDNLITDIGGAKNAAIDAVYLNPTGVSHNENVTYEIRSLNELTTIL
jgi:YjjG family noncanonical pyrimidine nucleotidase